MRRLVVTDEQEVAEAVAHGIDSALQRGLRVLWLLSGGSNISLELASLRLLKHATRDNLMISLIDERFLPLDSPHSNWHKLLNGGLNGEHARLEPPIIDWKLNLSDAAHDWARRLGVCTEEADIVIGQFGIGADGHTAGILPHTAGVHEHDKLVLGYTGKDYERLTTTPAFFKRIDLAIGVAMGDSKRQVISRMNDNKIRADEQPAQLLCAMTDFIMYTDQRVEWT